MVFHPATPVEDTDEDDGDVQVRLSKADSGSVSLDQVMGFTGSTQESQVGMDGELPWRYNMVTLLNWNEKSNALRQNVDAYATNIDGHGIAYEPEVDLEADDTEDRIRAIIQLEQQEVSGAVSVPDPTPAEIETRKKLLADEQRKELLVLDEFVEYSCSGISLVDLRRRKCQDVEVTGNGYWEIRRDAKNRPARFKYLEVHSMWLMPQDTYETPHKEFRLTATKKLEEVETSTQFRRYLQRWGQAKVYYKQYGDPRTISSKTGRIYQDNAAFAKAEPGDPDNGIPPPSPATEVMHFKIHSPLTPYGVPRWIGNITSVLGSRSAEEVNYAYFENKSVPPLALLVSGGTLSDKTVAAIEKHIENNIRGKSNYHKMLIIEAVGKTGSPLENAGTIKVELQPLTEAQNSDALFQTYDERNIDKVGMSFRVPRMLRGDTRDFNRSCYSEDTETLTENGWKLWHQIVPSEKIAAFDRWNKAVVFVEPAKRLVYAVVDEPMVEISNAHTNCLVTHDHTMLVSREADVWGSVPSQSLRSPSAPFQVFSAESGQAHIIGEPHVVEVMPAQVTESVYTGKVYCFSVPGYGFFVTRRNGKVAFQGNTSQAALDFAERQVFAPERATFDYWLNRYILPALGIKHWRIRSNGPTQRDPESLSKMIHDLQDVFSINTLMELAQPAFGRNFSRIDAEWADKPLKLVLAELQAQSSAQPGDPNAPGGGANLQKPTGAAQDSNPDNQLSGAEPLNVRGVSSDNKTRQKPGAAGGSQPRGPHGHFGISGTPKAPRKRQARVHNNANK